MSITISGASDDIIAIGGGLNEEFYYDAGRRGDQKGDILAFSDGTVLRIAFDPDGTGNWRITPVVKTPARLVIEQATGEDGTDKATLDGHVIWVVHGIGMVTKR
jgi:hypothetical protein